MKIGSTRRSVLNRATHECEPNIKWPPAFYVRPIASACGSAVTDVNVLCADAPSCELDFCGDLTTDNGRVLDHDHLLALA